MSARTFEIGIVMSGAAMAGAYTAGVVDFLVEALDAWEEARARRPREVPGHHVRLRVLAGASAGSLVTSTGAWMMLRGQRPTRTRPEPGRGNALWTSWVERGGLGPLLRTDDLPHEDTPLPSILDGTAVEAMTRAALERDRVASERPDLRGALRARPWIDPKLELCLTTSSLRGIPYAATYAGGSFHMRTCADHARFVLGDEAPLGAIGLDPADPTTHGWQQLVDATLASCAVPMALPSRYLETPRHFYDHRIEVPGEGEEPHGFVPPDWPPEAKDPYASLYIDGGLFDNAPLELAHRVLAGGRGKRNARDPKLATRALVLVDPCPGLAAGPWALEAPRTPDFLRDLLAFGLAVVYQPRFQPEDIALARSDRVASRFMLVPHRTGARPEATPLASGPIGAFGGALHASFREHDFFLGRRNCQQFLRRWFALDPENAIFAGESSAHDVTWPGDEGAVKRRPIIPLLGSAREEIPLPAWPVIDGAELARELEGPLARRLARVIRALAGRSSLRPVRVLGKRLPSEWAAAPIASRLVETFLAELREAALVR